MSFPGPVSGQTPADEGSPEPGAGADGYRRLNRKCMLSMYIDYAVWYAVLLVAYILTKTYAGGFLGSYYDLIGYGFLLALGIALVYIVAAPPVFYARYRYRITEDRVDVRCGILFIRHTLVPIERVHQVEITRGPINNILGLADVTITTAGGEATIRYLEVDEAEKVADRLNNLIGRMLRERMPTTAIPRPGAADE
ncbi:PH domain-containing protein [Methanoculleus sp. YWC-01]|jgi:membrane protein YdbS with pleckstrin-like domain|uniref:PH domain-containing protein n=1 Tax=Methanoculleus nereidis TaxID=2735141 RepID=A0ABU3Z480_9EURY|nr:PH domain-containing protein [Methanoculleus sp. YWC-01]MCK9299247.1 PH domain-containing protein [Methanoculleus sp.]MDV4343617.1 PH domain-containing protein [Methanoculleus sp. YWC-01]